MNAEEKAKRYDETLEQLKGLIEVTREDKCAIMEEDIINIFPELKESEDERIRKELIFYLGDMPEDTELRNGITNRNVLAWLEKQSEMPTWSEEDEKLYKLSLENLTDLMRRFGYEYGRVGDCINWFESIKGRFQKGK